MRTRAIGLCLFIGLWVASSGCTSFAFPSNQRTHAPTDLMAQGRMAQIPAGEFQMGGGLGEPDEYPPHAVKLPTFWMDRTEVTNRDYLACVEAKVCRASSFADHPVLGLVSHPVVGVTWFDAVRYCKWVSKRLPTEAEWEYAARQPKFSTYPWAGGFRDEVANSRGDGDGYPMTSPVGHFSTGQSGLGLLDMAGNAAEWTQDWYETTYYQRSPSEAPTGPESRTGVRVVRGGSWADTDYQLRTTARASLNPNFGKDSIGFRCVRAATPP